MLERFDRYVAAIWGKYGIWGFVLIALLLLGAAYLFGVDVGGYVNGLLGR